MERMLKEGKKKIYSGEKEIRDSHSSFVVNTLIRDCFLKCLSFDQIIESIDNANARKSISSWSSNVVNDFLRKCLYSESLMNSIFSSISFCLNSNSCSESPDLDKQDSLYLLNSDFINSGAKNFASIKKKIYEAVECGFISENKILLSNTIFIFYFDNSLLSLEESSASSLLNLPFLAFLPNSTDHLINSCSSLELSLLRKWRNKISRLTRADQLIQDNLFIFDLISSGIANVTVGIYISPLSTIFSNFSSCLILRMIMLLNTSDHFIAGIESIFFFRSSEMDNVTFGILIPPNNYVYIHKYVLIFKAFAFGELAVEGGFTGCFDRNYAYFVERGEKMIKFRKKILKNKGVNL